MKNTSVALGSYFDDFIARLNLRPRKCLGWKSPAEVFYGTLLHLT